FVGVRADDPPGGEAEVRCALDAKVNADGSVSGKVKAPDDDDPLGQVSERSFTQPGRWTCVARGGAPDFSKAYGTPWSSPLRFDVRSDFVRARGRLSNNRSRRPKFTVFAQFPKAAAGGKLTFQFGEVNGCRRTGPRTQTYRYKSKATFKGTFNSKSATVTLRT